MGRKTNSKPKKQVRISGSHSQSQNEDDSLYQVAQSRTTRKSKREGKQKTINKNEMGVAKDKPISRRTRQSKKKKKTEKENSSKVNSNFEQQMKVQNSRGQEYFSSKSDSIEGNSKRGESLKYVKMKGDLEKLEDLVSQMSEMSEMSENMGASKLEIYLKNRKIFCYICDQPMVEAVEAVCGDAFCELCIHEYFLRFQECPICKAVIRDRKLSINRQLNQISQQFVEFAGKEQMENFEARKKMLKDYLEQRKAPQIISGMEVDIRDEDFIWKKGIVLRTFNKLMEEKRIKYVLIRYYGSSKRQQFLATSLRLAPSGFYTNRRDIPRFVKEELIIEDENEIKLRYSSYREQSSEEAKNC